MARVLPRVPAAAPRPGDLVFFNTRRRPDSHVGIYVGQGTSPMTPGRTPNTPASAQDGAKPGGGGSG